MLDRVFGLGYYVVYIHFHRTLDQRLEYLIYQPLICNTYIFYAEGHNPIKKQTLISDKSSVFFVLLGHGYLIITRKRIHETKQAMTCCRIDRLVNLG